jgi:hypothetical protein
MAAFCFGYSNGLHIVGTRKGIYKSHQNKKETHRIKLVEVTIEFQEADAQIVGV